MAYDPNRQVPGTPIGVLLRNVDADELKARLADGEHLFVRGVKPEPMPLADLHRAIAEVQDEERDPLVDLMHPDEYRRRYGEIVLGD